MGKLFDKVKKYNENGYDFKLILDHKEVDIYSLIDKPIYKAKSRKHTSLERERTITKGEKWRWMNDSINNYKVPESKIKEMAKQPRNITFQPVIETNHIAKQQFKRAIEEYYILDKEAKKDRRFKSKYNFTPPCIQYILENGATEGQRNITIACLTCFCKNSGKSLNETIDFISDWNSNNVKPTGEMEMKKTIKSMFNGNKDYGCTTLKLISQCNESQCKLSKKKEG